MGYADIGLGMSLITSNIPFIYASNSKTAELTQIAKDYIKDLECRMIGCWKITENNDQHSSNNVQATENNYG